MTVPEAVAAAAARERRGLIVFLTGAGVSAASGVPTFRGPEGYWVVGSRNYAPQELATAATFRRHPEAVWAWYLYRRGVCLRARPNPAHTALVRAERALGDRFRLVTQNVDGLHRRAGNSPQRTYAVHGDLHFMRCAAGCPPAPLPLPPLLRREKRSETLTAAERRALTCPRCGGWMRPHVLWFDEYYDETFYRAESALRAAAAAALLVVAGTSGATTLPLRLAAAARHRGVPILNVNPAASPFDAAAAAVWRAPAAAALPALVAALAD